MPKASSLGLIRQPDPGNTPKPESTSKWPENAVLSRSSQMVGNTAQHQVLAPGSAVKRSHQLQPLGWRTSAPSVQGTRLLPVPVCVKVSWISSLPQGAQGMQNGVLGAIVRSDNRSHNRNLGGHISNCKPGPVGQGGQGSSLSGC